MAADDLVLRTCACNLMGVTICNDGDLREALAWLQQGLAAAAALGDALPWARFVVDPEVSMRANQCLLLVQTGLSDAARAQAQAALARARSLGQPMAHMLACWCACMLEVALDRPEIVLERVSEMERIVERHAVAQGEGPSRWYRGWAEAQLGQPLAGHKRILEGYGRHARFGMYAGCPLVLGYAADALALAGDWDGAQQQVEQALALAERIGEVVTQPDLRLRQAKIARARGDAAAEEHALRLALAGARRCGALRLELDALLALCACAGAPAASFGELRQTCAELPAGFDPGRRDCAQQLLVGH